MSKYIRIFILFAFFITAYSSGSSQTGKLRWAADSEGNAPYIFPDPRNPTRLMGFELDIANALAAELGKEAVFVQNQWDGLIPGLYRGDYDIALNGLEITEDRKREVLFSEPYYVTYLQIVVKDGNETVKSLSDLRGGRIGALKNSLAERIVMKTADVTLVSYEGEVNAFSDIMNGRIDAALVDAPIALYYCSYNKMLKTVGEPVGEVFYGIALRKGDTELLININNGIRRLAQNGKLREIFDGWNLWNGKMAKYLNDDKVSRTENIKYQYFLNSHFSEQGVADIFNRYLSFMPMIGKAAITTIEISILSMILAMFLGLIIALTRVYAPPPFNVLAVVFIEVIRGTPLLIQLFFIFYALPTVGLKLSPFVAAIVGLGINYAAYEAEVYRAGLFAVPRGQMEAALSLGMSKSQSLRHIIIPQASRIVLPPMTNDFISLLKDSSLVSVITLVELTKLYNMLALTYYDFIGTGILIASVYLLIGLPFVKLSKMAENYLALDKRKIIYR